MKLLAWIYAPALQNVAESARPDGYAAIVYRLETDESLDDPRFAGGWKRAIQLDVDVADEL